MTLRLDKRRSTKVHVHWYGIKEIKERVRIKSLNYTKKRRSGSNNKETSIGSIIQTHPSGVRSRVEMTFWKKKKRTPVQEEHYTWVTSVIIGYVWLWS